jgi:hypothetical protein
MFARYASAKDTLAPCLKARYVEQQQQMQDQQ